MTANAEARLAEARDKVWLGEVAEGADPVELDLERPPRADRNRTGRGQHRPDQPGRRRS